MCGIITEFTPHGTLYSFLLAKKKASVGRWSSIEEEETDGGWKVDTLSKQRLGGREGGREGGKGGKEGRREGARKGGKEGRS